MVGNILFPGNPYPAGHSIKDCKFFATDEVDGSVRLHLRLVTEDYSMSAANETDDSSDWTSKTVWDNYGHSIISSVDWGRRGFIVSENSKNFGIDDIEGQTFIVDTVDLDPESKLPLKDEGYDTEGRGFGIYLLGHDSCANHKITFSKEAGNMLNIQWSGQIALTYAGEDDYSYSFEAFIKDVPFLGLVKAAKTTEFVFSVME